MPAVQFKPHSCHICQTLVIKAEPHRDTGHKSRSSGQTIADKIIFNFTFRHLKDGASNGCRLCQWILDGKAIVRPIYTTSELAHDGDASLLDLGIQETISFVWDNDAGYERPSLREAVQEGSNQVDDFILIATTSPPFMTGLGRMSDILRIEYFGLWDPISKNILYRTQKGLECFALPGDPAATEISKRPIESNPVASLPEITSWIKECHDTHAPCRRRATQADASEAMPLRLIRIEHADGEYQVRLQTTNNMTESPDYVALSYCWGGNQPIVCTSGVVAKFNKSIPYNTLPATIQDAIAVCSQLGYSYLWVDALCIVQDDDTEKLTEIAKMTTIYSLAAVTIAASRASTALDGFLAPRVPDCADRAAFSLPCKFSENPLGSLTFVELDIGFDPIDYRGWTLQERLLSPRLLEFGSRQTRWKCQVEAYWDGVTDGWQSITERSPFTPNSSISWMSLGGPGGTYNATWEHLVEIYTERKLTNNRDRPLALAGIAEWLADLSKDEYLAGLWVSKMHTQLLWMVKPTTRALPPDSYQGPSWSWLSVNSAVWFHTFAQDEWSPEDVKIHMESYTTEPLIKSAPFGATQEGSAVLRLRGKLSYAKIHHMSTLHPDDRLLSYHDHELELWGPDDPSYSSTEIQFYPDCDIPQNLLAGNAAMGDVMALEVLSKHLDPTWMGYGIVLQRMKSVTGKSSNNVPAFRRLGSYSMEKDTEEYEREEGEDEDKWEQRVIRDLDWFKKLESSTFLLY